MAKLKIEVVMDLDTGAVQVKGPLDERGVVCNALARAITAVIERKTPVIQPVRANGNGHPGIIKTN